VKVLITRAHGKVGRATTEAMINAATHTLVPSDGLADEVAMITGGGAAYAFEAIGRVQTIESLPSLIAAGGKAVIVGLPPEDSPVSIDALALAESGKSLIGSNYGSTVPGRDFPRLAALYLAGRLPVDRLISHRIGLDEVNEAFDAMRRGERARSVIVF
jgi:Zn-dependent alcohol dehydrogenase